MGPLISNKFSGAHDSVKQTSMTLGTPSLQISFKGVSILSPEKSKNFGSVRIFGQGNLFYSKCTEVFGLQRLPPFKTMDAVASSSSGCS